MNRRFFNLRAWFLHRPGCSEQQPRVLLTIAVREQRLPSLRLVIGPVSEQALQRK
jgi:hypothetical protein